MASAIETLKRARARSREKGRFHDAPRLSEFNRSLHYRDRMARGGVDLSPSKLSFARMDDSGYEELTTEDQANFCSQWALSLHTRLGHFHDWLLEAAQGLPQNPKPR